MVPDRFETIEMALDIDVIAGHFNDIAEGHTGLFKNQNYIFKTLLCLCFKIRRDRDQDVSLLWA